MTKGQGASLNPADFAAGGAVPDGRYTIKAAQAVEFDYNGTVSPAVPAMEIVLNDGVTDYSQVYTAGKLENLVPSEDGTEFVHPGGGDAKIAKGSNLGAFVAAIANAGFPTSELTSKLTCFVGADIDIVNQAQQKRPGLKDQVEGKTIPLPTKYHGRKTVGKGKVAAGAPGRTAPAKAQPAASAAASSNGDLDTDTITRVQEALASAADNTLSVVKLGTTVWLTAQRDKNATVKTNAKAFKERAGNAEWLEANGETGGWAVDGDSVVMA